MQTSKDHQSQGRLPGLLVAALGIVFGDIGTSPLYALKTVVHLSGDHPSPEMALGLLSLMIWALIIIVALKYVMMLMSVNNRGEGGILSLMALLGAKKNHRPVILSIALFGAALIYADGAITPAISVLSALEGLELAMPSISHSILPIAVAVLVALFAVQAHGTDKIGFVFGPVMVLWFAVVAALGIKGVLENPAVLVAFNPMHGLHYLFTHGAAGYLTLGGVFLCVTGAEALYADMGHVGGKPIRIAWFGMVMPSLILNYAGQTAWLIANPNGDTHYFYQLCPQPLVLPLVILATCATVIASQAVITGAFSMTRQAIQLGWCPRLLITQTSHKEYGQIYVGAVNWMIMVATVGLALIFKTSDHLAAAYGIAVSMTMVATSLMLFVAMREVLHWNLLASSLVTGFILVIDTAFLGANLLKIADGGWVPLAMAGGIFVLMRIWRNGSKVITKSWQNMSVPVKEAIRQMEARHIPRVPGTAVFLTRTKTDVPPIMIAHLKRNKSLHQHVLLLSVVTEEVPYVADEDRLQVTCLTQDLCRAQVHYGFMEKPDIPSVLKHIPKYGFYMNLYDVTYYIAHETLLLSRNSQVGLPAWQEPIFAFMQRNSNQTPEFFNLPFDSVVEIGRWIEI